MENTNVELFSTKASDEIGVAATRMPEPSSLKTKYDQLNRCTAPSLSAVSDDRNYSFYSIWHK